MSERNSYLEYHC